MRILVIPRVNRELWILCNWCRKSHALYTICFFVWQAVRAVHHYCSCICWRTYYLCSGGQGVRVCNPSYDAQVFTWKRVRQTFRFCVLEPETVESATEEESSDVIHVICHRWMWCYYQSCVSCLREVVGSSPSRDTSCLGRRLRVFPVPAARFRDDVSSEAYLASFRVFSSDLSRCSSYLLTLYS